LKGLNDSDEEPDYLHGYTNLNLVINDDRLKPVRAYKAVRSIRQPHGLPYISGNPVYSRKPKSTRNIAKKRKSRVKLPVLKPQHRFEDNSPYGHFAESRKSESKSPHIGFTKKASQFMTLKKPSVLTLKKSSISSAKTRSIINPNRVNITELSNNYQSRKSLAAVFTKTQQLQ